MKTALAFASAVILIAMLFSPRARPCRHGSVVALLTDCHPAPHHEMAGHD